MIPGVYNFHPVCRWPSGIMSFFMTKIYRVSIPPDFLKKTTPLDRLGKTVTTTADEYVPRQPVSSPSPVKSF